MGSECGLRFLCPVPGEHIGIGQIPSEDIEGTANRAVNLWTGESERKERERCQYEGGSCFASLMRLKLIEECKHECWAVVRSPRV